MEQPTMRPVDTPSGPPAEPWWRRSALGALLVGLAWGAVGDMVGLAWWQTTSILVAVAVVYAVWSWRRAVARRRRPLA